MCPDGSGVNPVFLEFTAGDDIIIRTTNQQNGQKVLGVVKAYKNGGEVVDKEWEKNLVKQEMRCNMMTENLQLKYKQQLLLMQYKDLLHRKQYVRDKRQLRKMNARLRQILTKGKQLSDREYKHFGKRSILDV